MIMAKPTQATMIYMSPRLRSDLKAVCKRTGLSMNDVVREATAREIIRLRAEHPAYAAQKAEAK